jgi:hypothetical protein
MVAAVGTLEADLKTGISLSNFLSLGPSFLRRPGKGDNSLGLASLCETLGKLRQGTSEFWKEGPTLSLIMNVK